MYDISAVAEAKELMQSALRCMMGMELSQMSLLYFLTYVAAAGNLKNLVEATPYTAQEYKIKVLCIIVTDRHCIDIFLISTQKHTYRFLPNYHTYPYKRTVKQFRSLQIATSVLFVYFFIKQYVVGTHLNYINLSMQFK